MEKIIVFQKYYKEDIEFYKQVKNISEFLKLEGFKDFEMCKGYCTNIVKYDSEINKYVPLDVNIPKNSIIILFLPFTYIEDILLELLISTKIKNNNKIITIILDYEYKSESNEKYINVLNRSDYCIAINVEMAKFLKRQGVKEEIVSLNGSDYFTGGGDLKAIDENEDLQNSKQKERKYNLVYITRSSGGVNKLLEALDRVRMNRYYVDTYSFTSYLAQDIKYKNDIIYKGRLEYEKAYLDIDGDFGLVYPKPEVDPRDRKYLNYCCPVEESIFILAGIPLIVFENSYNASFVRKENLGLVIQSLDDIDEILSKLSIKRYNEMKRKVLRIREKYNKGFYIRKTIKELEL